jgi:hypothetical protein
MLKMRLIAMIAAVFAAATSLASSPTFAEPASIDDTARILAGMPPSALSPLAAYQKDAFWQQHARNFDAAWTNLDRRQLSKIRTFVSKNFSNPQPVLFYFFSGPDFMYADTFFPSADTYVMAGLEPPGPVPDITKLSRPQLAAALRELRSSLNSVLSYSFFRTKSMRLDFGSARLPGTLPVLMTFLVRSGKTINRVSLIDLQSDGSIHPAEDNVPNVTAKGAKIVFFDSIGKMKTLYYFSTDLSDNGIRSSGFMQFCDTLGHGDSFIKSASYLMHQDKFSTVRDYLLYHSVSILEDDSGIPIRYFAHGWRLYPYGRYVGPIPLFGNSYQSQLNSVFGKGRPTPIDFGIGYRWRPNESNLLLAVRDGTATALDIPPASPETVAPSKSRRDDIQEAKADTPAPRKKTRTYRRHKRQADGGPYEIFGYSTP